jgi:hypothetical protein
VRINFLALFAPCITLTPDLSSNWSEVFKHHRAKCQHQLGTSFEKDKITGWNFHGRRRGDERELSMPWMGGDEVEALTYHISQQDLGANSEKYLSSNASKWARITPA